MSAFAYNGVNLYLTRTRLFKVEPECDPSGADVLWNKYTLQVEGVLSESAGLPSSSAAVLAAVQHKLTVPRRALSYSVAGTSLLSVAAGGDAAYGPRDITATVTEPLAGVFFCSWSGTVRLVDCGGTSNPVVSLRWEQAEDYDENWFFGLKTSGLLVVRSDLRANADQFRALATPGVPNNCVREAAHYHLDPTGTQLRFSFTDREKHKLPPYPATKASGRFMISAPMPGAIRIAQADVSLEGPPGVLRFHLLTTAVRVALAKITAAGPLTGGQGQAFLGSVYGEELYQNKVTVQLQAKLNPIARSELGAGVLVQQFGVTPLSPDEAAGIAPPVRRQLFGLFAAAFRDPCAAMSALPAGAAGGASELRTHQPATLTTGPVPSQEVSLSTYSEDDPGGYDWYKVTSRYEHDSGKAQLPAAGGTRAADQKASVVRLHGGVMRLVVNWTARRRGMPPVLPTSDPPDPNYVYLRGWIDPEQIDASADGYSLIHTVSGHYEFAVLDPAAVDITAPVPPFLSDAAAEGAKLSAKFGSHRILWRFQGAAGPNPFVAGRTELAARPDDQLGRALGGNPDIWNGLPPGIPPPGWNGPGSGAPGGSNP